VPSATTPLVTGWWKVTFGGETLFHQFLANGRAKMARVAPGPTTSSVPVIASGNWFERAGIVTLIWYPIGSVEVWTRDPATGEFTIQRNSRDNGRAAHL